MNINDFEKALKNGTGNAIIFLKSNKVTEEHIEIIYEVSTCCYVYDKQCEGDRGIYLWNAIKYSSSSDLLQKRILTSMGDRDDYDLEQSFELAELFYKSGNKDSLDYMRRNLRYSQDWGSFIGSDQIISSEGIDGLLFVFGKIADRFIVDELFDGDYFLREELVEKYGLDKLLEILSPLTQGNRRFTDYLKTENTYDRSDSNRFDITYEQIKEHINEYDKRFMFVWGKRASEENIRRVALDLTETKDEYIALKLLSVFRRREFPLDYSVALKWLNSQLEEVVLAAIELLKEFKSEEIHKIAISRIAVYNNWYDFLPLLKFNYSNKDSKLIIDLLYSVNDEHIMHSIIMDFGKIIDNCDVMNYQLLNYMYLNGRCSICRVKIVEAMIQYCDLDQDKIAEFEYDSNEDVRSLVESIS